MEEQENLTFVDTDVLLSELARRCDAHVYISCKDNTESISDMTFETAGLFATCYGLANMALDIAKRQLGEDLG